MQFFTISTIQSKDLARGVAGKKAHELTSWRVGVLAVYHCPTPSAFVPWSKDLEAEDPEKFGSQNPCVAMTHIFSEVKGMEILGD